MKSKIKERKTRRICLPKKAKNPLKTAMSKLAYVLKKNITK